MSKRVPILILEFTLSLFCGLASPCFAQPVISHADKPTEATTKSEPSPKGDHVGHGLGLKTGVPHTPSGDENDATVFQWYASTKTTPVSIYDAELFDVFAAAECALDNGDNPPALFAWIVHGSRWDMLTNAQDDVARQRVLKLRNPKR